MKLKFLALLFILTSPLLCLAQGTKINANSQINWPGPRPYYDVTSAPYGAAGSNQTTTGTISSGNNIITLAAKIDFTNGQGIAVYGAGATSALSAPTGGSGSSIATVAHIVNINTSGMAVTHGITCSGGVATVSTFGFAGFASGASVTLAGDSTSGYDGTYTIASVASYPPTYFTISATCIGNSDGGTVTLNSGSTTFKYQIVAEDANSGYSAASSTITVGTANTLSAQVSNHLSWTASTGATQYLVYGDEGLGGALVCIGPAIATTIPATNPSWDDFGTPQGCPLNAPTNPPVSPTAQILLTTISSGGGTTSLTLGAVALNNVIASGVEHDDTAAINTAVATAAASGYGGLINLPAGTYNVQTLNFPITTPASNVVMIFQLFGTLSPRQPIVITNANYQFNGIGGAGIWPGVQINGAVITTRGLNPVIHEHGVNVSAVTYSRLNMQNCPGTCILVEPDATGQIGLDQFVNDNLIMNNMAPGSALSVISTGAFGYNIVGGIYSNGEGFSIQPPVYIQDVSYVSAIGAAFFGAGIKFACTGILTCFQYTVDERNSTAGGGESQNTPSVVFNATGGSFFTAVNIYATSGADPQPGVDNSIIEILGNGINDLSINDPFPSSGLIFSPNGNLAVKGVKFNCAAPNSDCIGTVPGTFVPTMPPGATYTDQNNTATSKQGPNNVVIQRYVANGTGPLWTIENPIGTVLASADVLGRGAFSGVNQISSGTWSGTCTLGTSCGITFGTSYSSTPVCIGTDQTAIDAVRAVPSTGGVTFTGNSTDVIAWACFGNPN